MKKYDEILTEGLYDPGIFKAFFLAGGPGSGKSFVTSQAFAGTGLKVVNSDAFLERMLKQSNLSLSMPDEEEYFRNIVRTQSKAKAEKKIDLHLKGRLGMVIDGTARNLSLIQSQYNQFKGLGYDCYMIFVNTSLQVALERNAKRERSVPEYITKKSWETVQSNMGQLQNIFGLSNFIVIDNNRSEQELVTITLNKVNSVVKKFLNTPIKSYIAKRWMAKERMARRK